MIKVMFLIVMWAMCVGVAGAQTALDVVWEKDVSKSKIDDAFISADGQYIYCFRGALIYKRSALNGDSISTFTNDFVTNIYDNTARISQQTNYITTTNGAGQLSIWDVKNEKALNEIKIPNQQSNQGLGRASFYPEENLLLVNVVSKLENNLSYSELVKYDWQNNKIINSSKVGEGNLTFFEISHDGKTFVTGTTYQKQNDYGVNKYHTVLTLWDAESFKEIKVLDDYVTDGSGSYIEKILFSYDDSRIMSLDHDTKVVTIYDTKTYGRIYTSDSKKRCFSMEILPDNIHYLFYFSDYSGTYSLELHNQDSLLNKYNLRSKVIRIYNDQEKTSVFCTSGSLITMLKAVYSSVDEILEKKLFSINYTPNIMTIQSNDEFEKATIQISDTAGNIVYEESFSPLTFKTIIKLNLPIGAYLCKITTRDDTHIMKFIVEN